MLFNVISVFGISPNAGGQLHFYKFGMSNSF